MKIPFRNRFFPLALIAALGFMPASRLTAQTFTTLHTFSAAEGSGPVGITLSGGTLYGVTYNNSTLFSLLTNGASFATLHNLAGADGGAPYGAPVLSGGMLYGTSSAGAVGGTVFKAGTNGAGFTVLHSFSALTTSSNINSDGSAPWAGLVQSGNTLYGTTALGGGFGYGTVYSVNTDGSGFTNLHSFIDGLNGDSSAKLVVSGNALYGTTRYGGSSGHGTVFTLNTDGTGFAILHNFIFDGQGYNPIAGLMLSGGVLYGTTSIGVGTYGTIFKLNTDGSGFAVVHSFTGFPNEGRSAQGGLTISGGTLYGATFAGGASDSGTVYSVNTDGSSFSTLYSFSQQGASGYNPHSELSVSNGALYGTALAGGGLGRGTVFSLTLPCAPANITVALYAGISVAGTIGCAYEVDYTTNLTNPTWVPMVTNTLASSPFFFIDTNVISGVRFYRAITQ